MKKQGFTATHVMRAGWGYHTRDGNFARTSRPTPVRIARDEYAKPHNSIVYTEAGERWHADNRSLVPTGSEPEPATLLKQAT